MEFPYWFLEIIYEIELDILLLLSYFISHSP